MYCVPIKKFWGTKEQVHGYTVWRAGSLGVLFSTAISPAMIYRLKRIIDNYDIIHVHHPDPMANLALFLAKPKGRLIVHWHSDIVRQKRSLKLYEPLLRWMLRRADVIIASSEAYKKGSLYLRFFHSKLKIIPYGISADGADLVCGDHVQELQSTFGNRKVVLSLGRLVYYKGLNFLVHAAVFLPKEYVIVIAGDGPLRNKLEKLSRRLGVADRVHFLGEISDEQRWLFLRTCDVFVLPSLERSESFGIVQVEAMACGKPVISTGIRHSGVGWVNRDGVTGRVVPPGDPKALAQAVIEIVENKNNYALFCQNSLLRFQDIFHIHPFACEIIKTYENVLGFPGNMQTCCSRASESVSQRVASQQANTVSRTANGDTL